MRKICLEELTTPMAAHVLRKRLCSDAGKLIELRPGNRCPACGRGRLGYDGLLNLACSKCDFALVGGFT